jgi:hypothetical protein
MTSLSFTAGGMPKKKVHSEREQSMQIILMLEVSREETQKFRNVSDKSLTDFRR